MKNKNVPSQEPTQEEIDFKEFVANIKSAIDEDLAHPENFEDDEENLEAFKAISKGLSNVDNLSRIELFQLGMEVGGLIHMMELSHSIFDAIEEEEEDYYEEDGDSCEWEQISFTEEEEEKPRKKNGGCGNCGCH